MTDLDLSRFEVLTFDCYGTLIDWEAGILAAARPVLGPRGAAIADEDLLERYARHEAALEMGPYRSYRAVLAESIRGVGHELGVDLGNEECASFAGSVPRWPPFSDSAAALASLRHRYRLGVITNCDDDLFAASNAHLGSPFEWVVTAQQVRAYKPATAGFERAFELIGRPRETILHVAQSLYHDHVPAKRLGLTTAWVNRRAGKRGSGATLPAGSIPDLVVADLEALATLALGADRDARGEGAARPPQ